MGLTAAIPKANRILFMEGVINVVKAANRMEGFSAK